MNHFKLKNQLTLPNFLTLVRLCCIPYLVYLIVQNQNQAYAFFGFSLIWMTDVLDGYLARRFNQISDLGKVFDPFVDKCFQISTALSFLYIQKFPLWALVTLVFKELLLTVGGLMLWNRKTVVSSHWYGKVTTFLYVLAFSILFFLPQENVLWKHLLFVLPTLLSYYALVSYTILHKEALKELKPTKVKQARPLKNRLKMLLKHFLNKEE